MSEPSSGMARDSSIKRFELCFELSWKVIQKHYLRDRGLSMPLATRDCFREAFAYGLFSDERTMGAHGPRIAICVSTPTTKN